MPATFVMSSSDVWLFFACVEHKSFLPQSGPYEVCFIDRLGWTTAVANVQRSTHLHYAEQHELAHCMIRAIQFHIGVLFSHCNANRDRRQRQLNAHRTLPAIINAIILEFRLLCNNCFSHKLHLCDRRDRAIKPNRITFGAVVFVVHCGP